MIAKSLFYSLSYLVAVPKLLSNWFDVRILKRHLKYEIVQTCNLRHSGKFTIIAVYPGTGTLHSLRRQVELFAANEYNTLVVLNSNLNSAKWAKGLAGFQCTIMLRPNLGADFGAYKVAINHLQNKHGTLISELVLANDSMFYTPESSLGLKSFFEDEYSKNCLFLHKQSVRHAASMLLKFDTSVLKKNSFWEFWRGYYPYCIKNQIVRKGEHALTRVVGIDYFRPIVNLVDLSQHSINMEVSEIIQAESWSRRSSTFIFDQISLARNLLDYRRILEISISNLQVSNAAGLWASRNLKIPFKLDLPQSGLCTISDLIRIASVQGCNQEDLAELQKVLEGRPTVSEGSYFKNSLKFLNLIKINE